MLEHVQLENTAKFKLHFDFIPVCGPEFIDY